MPVQQVTESVRLEPDRVYVIPPNANLEAIDTHLRLSRLERKRRERAPIDHFLRTLSRRHDGHAVAVVLTGTGGDGTTGLREIMERGGLAIVQDPDEAAYNGMPRSAIATGLVDMILPLAQISDAILGFSRTQPRIPMPRDGEEPDEGALRMPEKIFARIRTRTGRDFTRYKRSTTCTRSRSGLRSTMRAIGNVSIGPDRSRCGSTATPDSSDSTSARRRKRSRTGTSSFFSTGQARRRPEHRGWRHRERHRGERACFAIRGPARAGAPEAAGGYRGVRDQPGRAQGIERGASELERGASLDARGAGNVEGRAADRQPGEPANGAARTVAGLPPRAERSRTLLEIYPQVVDTQVFDWWVEATENGTTIVRQRFPIDVAPYGGKGVRYVDFQITRHAQGFMSAWRDVTDDALHEESLQAAKDRAEQASNARAGFLSTLSHELRTPLNAVIGLTELIDTEVVGPLNQTQKDYMARIRSSAWYQLSMIEDILNFTRADEGHATVRHEPIDVGVLAREVADMFERTVRKKGIRFAFATGDGSVVTLTDGGKLRQILANLIGNAIKFTDAGTVDATFEVEDGELIFAVRDTG